jgi:hypothetical protein
MLDKLNNTYYTAYFKDNLLFNFLNNKTILKIKLVLKYANIIKIYLMKILLKLLIILWQHIIIDINELNEYENISKTIYSAYYEQNKLIGLVTNKTILNKIT